MTIIFPLPQVTGTIKNGAGDKLADRIGTVAVEIKNGDKSVFCTPDVMKMPRGRDLVIGLSHFNEFGYERRGIPVKPPAADSAASSEEKHCPGTADLVDGLSAAELAPAVEEALQNNKHISAASRYTHELAFLNLKPTNNEKVWKRANYVSRQDEFRVNEKIEVWRKTEVIEIAPEGCTNCFPLLSVPKKDAYGKKVDVRHCLDLRLLNQNLSDISYPLPKIQDIINDVGYLSGPDVLYSTIDIKDSYFRFRIPEEDRNWTAFKVEREALPLHIVHHWS